MYDAFTKPYESSKYAKEELPVWSEIWEQFMLNEAFIYDPKETSHNTGPIRSAKPNDVLNATDTYYQQSHRKLLLGWVTNELNKLVNEDGRLSEVSSELSEIIGGDTLIRAMSFQLIPIASADPKPPFIGLNSPPPMPIPPIYTQLSPVTKSRSIFASDYPSVDMAAFTEPMELMIEMRLMKNGYTWTRYVRPSITGDHDLMVDLLMKFLEPIRIYFEEPIGWKDEGYVPQPLTRRCQNAGVDPSL